MGRDLKDGEVHYSGRPDSILRQIASDVQAMQQSKATLTTDKKDLEIKIGQARMVIKDMVRFTKATDDINWAQVRDFLFSTVALADENEPFLAEALPS